MTFLRKALLVALVATAACDQSSRLAMGDVNSIIVVAEDSLWAQVSDTLETALQPRIFAVRAEPTFLLTHTSPTSEHWAELRRFRQVLTIGGPEDPWVKAALDQADTTVTPPALVEVNRVWARNQRVTALVVGNDHADWIASMADSLGSLLDARYRTWAQNRMYLSGHDTVLVDTLRTRGGFRLDVPVVYRWRQLSDSTYAFLNDNPDASELVRWLTVTWRSLPTGRPTTASLLAWRDSVASSLYDWGQQTDREPLRTTALPPSASAPGIEVRGVWSSPDEFPQAGPFIARLVDCPDQGRRYLLDAWLYAPAKDKYQYMIQLETLLDSFRCGRR